MKNKLHKQLNLRRILISLFCLLLITTFINFQRQTSAQTVPEKRYKPELIVQTGHSNLVQSVAFSPNGRLLASSSSEEKIRLWESKSGKLLRILNNNARTDSIAFSQNSRVLVSAGWGIKFWDVESGLELQKLAGNFPSVNSITFSPDGKMLAIGSYDKMIKLWDVEKSKELQTLIGHSASVNSVAFSRDGKILASGSDDKTIKLWDSQNGNELRTLIGHSSWVHSVAFNKEGRILVSGGVEHSIKLWDVESGKELRKLSGHSDSIYSIAFSPNGDILASGSRGVVKLWDLNCNKELRSLTGHKNVVKQISFNSDGNTLASGSWDGSIKIWDTSSGKELLNLSEQSFIISSIAFDQSAQMLAQKSLNNAVALWNMVSGKNEFIQFPSFEKGQEINRVFPKLFGMNKKAIANDFVAEIEENRIKLSNKITNKKTADLFNLGENGWVVTTPDGSFEASPDALKLMHYVVFVPNSGYEVITLDQIKSKSYTPDLLKDIYAGKRTPGADNFLITLYPNLDIRQANQNSNRLNLKLENRGGGIGRVEVYLNGKVLLNDARAGKSVNPKAATVNLPVEIPKNELIAGVNKVEVITWNTEGEVRSRSKEYGLTLGANGAVRGSDVIVLDEKKQTYNGHFYAIVAGISDYAGSGMDLRFAAKDAEDMSHALALGARRLFCSAEFKAKKTCERVHIRTLSTEKDAPFEVKDVDFKRFAPTKPNFKDVFAEIAQKTKPEDVVVIYFAGHGTAITSEEVRQISAFPDLYIYPTMEAETLDKLTLGNKHQLDQKYVTSLELADWTNKINAERKAMIFDTCAAGAIQADLTKQARNDGDEDKFQIRALDRLRERTGFFVLMGSAADSVSYEASNFRQGLMTYSLLEAMNVKLRDDRFVDVEDWFKYAEEKVDNLAKGIGGIQRPRYFKSNFNAQSFDVGEINAIEDKIRVASPVPMILQPVLLDKTQLFDSLNLTETLIPKLRELSVNTTRGEGSAINYIPARQAKGGIITSGLYTVSGENVTVLVLRMDEKELAKLEVKGTKKEIAEKLLQAITSASKGELKNRNEK